MRKERKLLKSLTLEITDKLKDQDASKGKNIMDLILKIHDEFIARDNLFIELIYLERRNVEIAITDRIIHETGKKPKGYDPNDRFQVEGKIKEIMELLELDYADQQDKR